VTEISDLPHAKRVQRYLDLADEAQREARRTSGRIREAYLVIAERWMDLANETAKQFNALLDPLSDSKE